MSGAALLSPEPEPTLTEAGAAPKKWRLRNTGNDNKMTHLNPPSCLCQLIPFGYNDPDGRHFVLCVQWAWHGDGGGPGPGC